MHDNSQNPVTEGISRYPGTVTELATALGYRSYQAIRKWEKTRRSDGELGKVPDDRVNEFAKLTGLTPEQIRPDLAKIFRKTAA